MKNLLDTLNEALSNQAKKEAEGKMDAWHDGRRKQNIKSCSTEKLRMNLAICQSKGYTKEAEELQAELIARGEDKPIDEKTQKEGE